MKLFKSTKIDSEQHQQLFVCLLLTAACLAIFNRLFSTSRLPPIEFYKNSVLSLSAVSEAAHYSTVLTAVALFFAVVLLIYFCVRVTWSDVCSVQIKQFLLFVVFLMVWRNATYGPNYLVDMSHGVDRLLLIAVFLLSFWRPVFVFAVPLLVYLLQGQINLDFMNTSLAETSIAIKILVSFCVLLLFSFFSKRRFDSVFVWLTIIIIMSHYWTAAYAKYLLSWHKHGEIHYMMAASYAGGWLNFIDQDTMSSLLRNLSRLNPFSMVITIAFETAVIFALFHRTLLVFLLLLAIIFHTVVFAMSGINFWQWALIDLAFIYFLYMKSNKQYLNTVTLRPYTKATIAFLIASSPWWMGAPRLGWHDSPISYIYQVRAFDAHSNSTILRPAYFTPYEYRFTLNSFNYLPKIKTLPISWGATQDLPLVKTLHSASSEAQIFDIIEQQGTVKYDDNKAQKFDQFVAEFVKNKQSTSGRKKWFDSVPAPLYLYTTLQSRQRVAMSIERIEIHLLTSRFDGMRFQTIEDELVRSINIKTGDDS